MTLQGIIIIDIVALLFMAGVLLLLRAGMIYAGYAALWICSTLGVAVLVSVPPLLAAFTSAVGAVFPVSALTLLAFIFIVVVLVLFSIRLTQLHERQTAIIQVLSLRTLSEKESHTSAESDASRAPDVR
jgi:hypothetical protein